VATVPAIPLEKSDIAASKIDVFALKTSCERLERSLEKLTDKLDKLADKVAELSGDLREVKTKVGIMPELLGAVGVLLATQLVVFFFQHVQPAPVSTTTQPAPAVQQSNILSADDIQKLKKLLDSQPSPRPG
jgi:hypothetical protein